MCMVFTLYVHVDRTVYYTPWMSDRDYRIKHMMILSNELLVTGLWLTNEIEFLDRLL